MPLDNYMQTGWVVKDLDNAIKYWRVLGAGPFFVTKPENLPEREYRGQMGRDQVLTAHAFLGTEQIELMQPLTDDPSLFREVLDPKGEGLHHIQPNAGVLDKAGFEARAEKYRETGLEIVQSMSLTSDARVVFFDALKQMGIFIELVQRPPLVHQITVDMHEAHLGWDGTNPIRENPLVSLMRGR